MARWSKTYAGNPNTHVMATKGVLLLDTSTPAIWQNTDGSSTWTLLSSASAGGTGIGSVVVTSANPSATVDLSAEGTIDWIYTPTEMGTLGAWGNNFHGKRDGGWLLHTLEVILGISGGATETHTTVAGTLFSSTNTDDRLGVNPVASSDGYDVLYTTSGAPTGFGFKFRIPARTTKQVARVYLTLFSCTVTIAGKTTLSGATGSTSITVGAVQTNKVVEIDFNGQPGDELAVTALVTTNGGSASISMAAVTVGTV